MSQPRTPRPRGSAVWVGLDDFGDDVVSRLSRWFTDGDIGQELADANKLLPRLRIKPEAEEAGPRDITSDILLEGEEILPGGPADDLSIRQIMTQVGELLNARQSRRALAFTDRELLVPHIWLVADLTSPETTDLAEWSKRLLDTCRRQNVPPRIFFLFRHLSWQLSDAHQREAIARAEKLVSTLVDESSPGIYGFMAYVLTDRDAIGGLYQDTGERRETAGLAYRFSDFIMLTDVPHGHVDTGEEQRPNFADPRPGTPPLGMERAFVSPTGRRPGGWENIPVFASVASNCVLWDGLTVGIENAESRRNQLFAALNTPVPLGYDPNYPEVGVVNVATGAKWPSLDVPRWAPRFWRAARPEYDRVQELIEGFIRDAGKWRHAMLVTHQDRRDHTPTQAHAALDAYERDLNAIERTVLDDSSLEGFFDPLNRIYDRADSNIRILLAPPPETAATPMSTEDAIAAAKPPADAMTNADTQLVRAIERKINPLLLLQVLVMTVIICTTVLSWILIGLRSSYYGSFGAISAFWEDSLRQVRGIGPDALTLENPRFKALVELIQDEWFVGKLQQPWLKAFPWKIPGIGSWLADLPEPSQIVLISALIFGVPLVAIGIFTALRQRVKLEQAWRVIYRRATAWRDNIAHRFPKDIEALEAAINRQSLESARDILRRRRAELEAFRILGLTPFTASIDDPHTITKTLRAGIPGVQGLSDLQVVQTIARFKREAASLPSQRWTAGYLLDMLRAQAAEVAGDVVPSLGDELPVHRRTILTSMPPDGAVRRPPCATTDPHGFAPPAVVRFLSVPGEVIEPFVRTNPDLVTVLPLPIEDRFYTVVIQSGLTASNLFSCTDTWEASTPDRNGGAA